MKNQYFADVNDYTKYCILRQFSDIPKIIYWMLTQDDHGPDGRKLEYTQLPKCASLDQELWNHLKTCVKNKWRNVSYIEGWLGKVIHYEKRFIDNWSRREIISHEIISMSSTDQIVFLDPDNGYQVPSCPKGRRNSRKYVYGFEISELLKKNVTIIFYQHLRMGQRTDSMIKQFAERWKDQYWFAVRTSYAVYYFLSKNDLDWAMQKLAIKENENPHTGIRLLPYTTATVEKAIKFAEMVLNPDARFCDLDCAAWGLQQTLTLDSQNEEAAGLLKKVIAKIDQQFDAAEDTIDVPCHIAMGKHSPSPYVSAKEPADLQKRLEDFFRRRELRLASSKTGKDETS